MQKTLQTLHEQVMAIKSPTRRPYVRTKIAEQLVLLLYDTGADISCINAKSLHQINPQARFTVLNSINRFQAAGGQQLKVLGTTMLSCEIDQKTVQHKFFVIENLNEKGILGIDFISKHDLNHDPKANTFYWRNENKKHNWRHGKIFCTQDMTLDALSVTQIKVKIETDDGAFPAQGCHMAGQISVANRPLLTGKPCLFRIVRPFRQNSKAKSSLGLSKMCTMRTSIC
jgi:Retroviral aspartyl protease